MNEHGKESVPRSADPVMPIDYGRPPPTGFNSNLSLGIIITLLLGVGSGALSFALMMVNGMNDSIATIGALGVVSVVIGLCLIGMIFWLRRPR